MEAQPIFKDTNSPKFEDLNRYQHPLWRLIYMKVTCSDIFYAACVFIQVMQESYIGHLLEIYFNIKDHTQKVLWQSNKHINDFGF